VHGRDIYARQFVYAFVILDCVLVVVLPPAAKPKDIDPVMAVQSYFVGLVVDAVL
jgi:hypothetical protein